MSLLTDALWFVTPVGVLETLRAKRAFQGLGTPACTPWRAALSSSMREKLEVSRLRHLPPGLLSQPGCIVDVGAHVGNWSEAVLDIVEPPLHIAIEPSPDSFAQLSGRIGSRKSVQLKQCAVGAVRGEATFHLMTDGAWNSFQKVRNEMQDYYPKIEERQSITVDVLPLDEILHDVPAVTLLKIDIQGGESELLKGAAESLRKTSALLLEVMFVSHYTGDALFTDLHRHMTEQFGFQLFKLADPYHQDGRLLYADAVYVNKEWSARHPPLNSRRAGA